MTNHNFTLEQFAAWLDGIRARMAKPDMQAGLPWFSKAVFDSVRRRFETSTDYNGNGWKPLVIPRPGKILILTGALYETAKRSATDGATFQGNTYTGRYSGTDYGAYHEYGTSRMVARSFWGLDNDSLDNFASDFADSQISYLLGIK